MFISSVPLSSSRQPMRQKNKSILNIKIDQGAIENRRNYFESTQMTCAMRLIRFQDKTFSAT